MVHYKLEATNKAREIGEIHENMLKLAWIILANIGLWAHYFKYRKWALPLHKAVMLILTLVTWLAIFAAIVLFGIDNDKISDLHVVIGLVIMVLSAIASSGGILCSILQSSPNFKPFLVKIVRKAHKIAGWAIYVIVLVQFVATTSKKHFLAILIINSISIAAFLILKTFNKKMQSQSKLRDSNIKLRLVKSSSDLAIYNKDYYIFADRVYDISQVITNHPAGWQIIKAIKTRQVDRYLYGIEPLENSSQQKSQVLIHKHTKASTSMMGDPLGLLYSPQSYHNLQQVNTVCIEDLMKPCRSQQMYAVYLMSKMKPFKYKGYTELCELGRYYTVHLKNKTKLYSCVNFLHASNLKLMQNIIGSIIWENIKVVNYNGTVHEVQIKQNIQEEDFRLLPLFIKKYQNGAFTKQFLSGNCTSQVKISKAMGRGLCLQQMPPGIIIMFAGGTGLNVFCDLIDLVFKQTLVLERNALSNNLIQHDPILSTQAFTKFQFILYIAVQKLAQIHPITLFQINFLAQKNRLKIWIKSKDNTHKLNIKQHYPNIMWITQRFQMLVEQWMRLQSQISQIFVCGTPEFNGSIIRQLNRNQFPAYKRKIM